MRHLLWLFVLPLAAQTNFANGDFKCADKTLGSQWCSSYSWSTSSPTVQGSDDMYNQNYVSVSVQKEDFDGSCYAMASHAQVLMSFDTSAIGSGATVTAATLYFFVDGRTSSSAYSHSLHATPFTTGNYTMIGCATPGSSAGSKALTSLTAYAWNSLAIAASAINKTGTTSLRLSLAPCPSDPPSPGEGQQSSSGASFSMRRLGYVPYLAITYTLPGGPRLIIVTEGD